MKKIIFFSISVITILLTSCSKETKLNRKIDGDWLLIEMNDQKVTDQEELIYSFEKDRKGKGNVQSKNTNEDGIITTYNGTYTLIEDTKIIMTFNYNGLLESQSYLILKATHSKLKLADSEGVVIELRKE
jgi:hypothetical protein